MTTLKAYHYYVRKKEYDKCSFGIAEIMPIEERHVSNLFAEQYEDMIEKKKENHMDTHHE